MKQPPKTEANLARNVTVLSVSPIPDDHISLKQIIHYSEFGVHSDSRWELNESLTLTSAVSVLRQQQIPVVICERDLQPGTWREMLEQVGCLPTPPLLIVTSRLADERLWAEALNLGAYDVLAKPFDKREVIRTVTSAWLHWPGRFSAWARQARRTTATARMPWAHTARMRPVCPI
jgi:DNA-binding NtrC family response regulator